MNPEGFTWSMFDYPIQLFKDGLWSEKVGPLVSDPESKLKFEEEQQLCNYNDFVHVYHFVTTGASVWGSNWEDGTRSFFVKHKSGYYIYFYAVYDSHAGRLHDWSFIRYSKSWSSLYYRKFTKEERTAIKTLPWYKSCERTRAALLALSVLQRNGLFARDLFRMVAERVWEKRFNN